MASGSQAARGEASLPVKFVDYLRNVRTEMNKVTWPGWEDLRRTTMVICIVVIAIGIVIGLMDKLFALIFISVLPGLFG